MDTQNIGLFKLTSGEEIVAQYIETEYTYVIKAARAILLARDSTGLTLQLGPWILSEQNSEYVINKLHVVTTNLKISPKLEKAYLENVTGVKIETNATKLITS